jgi:hypothetical protein
MARCLDAETRDPGLTAGAGRYPIRGDDIRLDGEISRR